MVDPSCSLFSDPGSTAPRLISWNTAHFGMMMSQVYQFSDDEALVDTPLPDDQIQPYVFAPLMGAPGSYMTSASAPYEFKLLYVQRPGDRVSIQGYLVDMFGFSDLRDNTGTGSINKTIDRVMSFLSDNHDHVNPLTGKPNNYAMWDAEQKYYDYWSDQPASFKTFGPLYGLSAAVITDDEWFYTNRALPHLEYCLSRNNNAFVPYDTEITGQLGSGVRDLGTTFLSYTNLAALHGFFQGLTPYFKSVLDTKTPQNSFPDLLAKWRVYDDSAALAAAIASAKAKIHAGGADVWSQVHDWLDICELSKDDPTLNPDLNDPDENIAVAHVDNDMANPTWHQTFLEAAHASAYEIMSHEVILSPSVPTGTATHDPGGVAPLQALAGGRNVRYGYPEAVGYPILPDRLGPVPAWRLALNGLQSSGTNRGEFIGLFNWGAFMRVASIENDPLLKSIGRWGFVGRFASFPGDNRAEPSLVMEDPNLAENPVWKQTFSTFLPCHAWEFSAELLDFLISDFYYSSNQQITFPWRSIKGTGIPLCFLYGDRPGSFYKDKGGDDGVRIWLPAGLFTIRDNSGIEQNPSQIDYIAGYGTGANEHTLYVAFINRSASSKAFKATVNTDRVTFPANSNITRKWLNNPATASLTSITIPNTTPYIGLPGKQMVAFAIPNATFATRPLQDKMFAPDSVALDATRSIKATSFAANTPYAENTVNGMLLSLGKGLTQAFIYSNATARNTVSVTFHCTQGTSSVYVVDKIFPYECSIPFDETKGQMNCTVTLKGNNSVNYPTSPSYFLLNL